MGDRRFVWERAYGTTVVDTEGREYIDFTSGVLVTNVGHSHPDVTKAIQDQAAKLLNCYDAPHPGRELARDAILRLFPKSFDHVSLLTTGAEAIETAVKFARAATGRREIVSFHGGFHGRTALTMALGGNSDLRRGAGSVVPGIVHVPYPYCYRCPFGHGENEPCPLHSADYLKWFLKTTSMDDVAAIVVEPYQGAGGCIVPPEGFLESLASFARDNDILLVFDEIQSGFGRTGSMFAFEQKDIVPDIVCLAKGLASGIPASAVVTRSEIAGAMPAGAISSTYGGNPLACAAIVATIDVMEREALATRARTLGATFAERLQRLRRFDRVGDVRSWGLVAGVEFVQDRASKQPDVDTARRVVREAARRGLALIEPTGLYGNVTRLMPPLVMSEADLAAGLDILEAAVEAAVRAADGAAVATKKEA